MTGLHHFYQAMYAGHQDEAWDRAPGKDVLIRAVEHAVPAEAAHTRLVDIGCGTGYLLERIRETRPALARLCGVDFAAAAIERGHVRYPHLELSCQDGAATSYADESFEVVVSYGSIEHFPDPSRALVEVARLLVPGGRFLIMLPTLGAYRTDRDDEGWYDDLTGQPQWNLRRGSWLARFENAGLAVDDGSEATRCGARQPDVYFMGHKPVAPPAH